MNSYFKSFVPCDAALGVTLFSAILCLSACGGGAASPTPAPAPASPTIAERKASVEATITANTKCGASAVGDFYWEIGDASGSIASGGRGTSWDANTQMNIASASKWVTAAFVSEKVLTGNTSKLSPSQIDGLRMTSGYVSMTDLSSQCVIPGNSLQTCANDGSNSTLTPSSIGKFMYSNGHAQQLLLALGYGSYTAGFSAASSFGPEVRQTLGINSSTLNDFNFTLPIVSEGMRATPGEYGAFLRKLIATNNPLKLKSLLGTNAVCTRASATCNTAIYSPVPEDWTYSLHHWVEPDGSFSSPGKNGFYPWVDQSKQTYGILARQASDPTPAPAAAKDYVYWKSVECGRDLRKAWLTASVVPN